MVIKHKKDKGMSQKEISNEIDLVESEISSKDKAEAVQITASKPISKIKKGDKIKIDDKEYEVDAHYALIDHGESKEMAIEIFDAENDKDLQIRYFDDQVESTLELYELQEIMYVRRQMKNIAW